VLNPTAALPRFNPGAYAVSKNEFYLFGGIYANENDFHFIGSGATKVIISENEREATVTEVPKQANSCKIRPKMSYVVDRIKENTLLISNGYGR
jgi:hypothetical protein